MSEKPDVVEVNDKILSELNALTKRNDSNDDDDDDDDD